MGNFSRDPRNRITDSIAKHYVSIPLQQAVPILDADWNELENLRRHQHETLGGRFIGSGVPDGDDGFRIVALGVDNDFSIRRGAILINGKHVVNDIDTTYSAQPNAALAPALTTPNVDTTLIAFLDTFEREVDSQEDPDLVDNRIGVETCVRLKTEWVVRVIEAANPQALPAPTVGHHFLPLAVIRRVANNARITFAMLTDHRRLHLTLAQSTKAPLELFGANGNLVFTLDNFADMLDTAARAYFDVLNSDLFMVSNFSGASSTELAVLSAIFNEVTQTCHAASLQAKIRNLSNQDGLRVLQTMYTVQDHFVDVITPMTGVPARATTAALLLRLRELLDGGPGTPGLQPAAFTSENLDAAIEAQQEINRELGSRTQILPHGHLAIQFVDGPPPATIITAGSTFRYQYSVTYERTIAGPAQIESFDLLPSLTPPGWTVAVVGRPDNRLTLSTEQTESIAIDVTVTAAPPASSTLNFRVRSRLNPTEMDTTNSEVALTIGSTSEQPPVLHLDLVSPAMNLETDTLLIGRGGPFGLPQRARNLLFRFTTDEVLGAAADYTVSFVSTPALTLDPLSNVTVDLGGAEPTTKQSLFTVQATEAALEGATGTLTVRIEKVSDATVNAQLVINYQVDKLPPA